MRLTTNLLFASLMFSSVLSIPSEPRLLRRSGFSRGGVSTGGGDGKKGGIFNRLFESILTKLMSGVDESRRVNSELPHHSELDLEEWENERLLDAQRRREQSRSGSGRDNDRRFNPRRTPRRNNRQPESRARRTRRLERRQFQQQQPPHFINHPGPQQQLPQQVPQMFPSPSDAPNFINQHQGNAMTENSWTVKGPVHFRTFAGRTYMYDTNSGTWIELTPRLARMLMTEMAYMKWLQLNQGVPSGPVNAPTNAPNNNLLWNPNQQEPRIPRNSPRFGIPQPIQNPTNPWNPRSPNAPFTPPGMNDANSPHQGPDILTRTMAYLNSKAVFTKKFGGKYGIREEYLYDEIFGRE